MSDAELPRDAPMQAAPAGTVQHPKAEVRDMRPGEAAAAVGVLARGMRDNPLHVRAYGTDPARRERCAGRVMAGLFRAFPDQEPICAVDGETLLAVTGVAPPGTCRPTAAQRARLLPGMLALGPRSMARVGQWLSAWAKHDPDEPHVHLGPFAVDAHLQRQGIGSLVMREHCRRLDSAGRVGYLETDKAENVPFYERFGYHVVDQATVLGVPNWFMRREERPRGA